MHSVMRTVQYFLLLAIATLLVAPETSACDTKWIRSVYMLACGKKKRDHSNIVDEFASVSRRRSQAVSEPISRQLMRAFLGMDRAANETTTIATFLAKLTPRPQQPPTFSGMRMQDSMLILEDLIDENSNDLHRREISQLLEKCCRVPPTSSCSAKDFYGACK